MDLRSSACDPVRWFRGLLVHLSLAEYIAVTIRKFSFSAHRMADVDEWKGDGDADWIMALSTAIAEDISPLQLKLAHALRVMDDLVDPDPCWFDHHGGCQAHGYFSIKPGEKCPNQEARDLLAG